MRIMGSAAHEIRISLVAVFADIQTFDFLMQADSQTDRRLDQIPRYSRSDKHKSAYRRHAGQLGHQQLCTAAEKQAVARGIGADPVLRKQAYRKRAENAVDQVDCRS